MPVAGAELAIQIAIQLAIQIKVVIISSILLSMLSRPDNDIQINLDFIVTFFPWVLVIQGCSIGFYCREMIGLVWTSFNASRNRRYLKLEIGVGLDVLYRL